jgi:hypothetical protein
MTRHRPRRASPRRRRRRRGATLHLWLDARDKSGKTSHDHVIVLVENPHTPRTEISFHGDPGDSLGWPPLPPGVCAQQLVPIGQRAVLWRPPSLGQTWCIDERAIDTLLNRIGVGNALKRLMEQFIP